MNTFLPDFLNKDLLTVIFYKKLFRKIFFSAEKRFVSGKNPITEGAYTPG